MVLRPPSPLPPLFLQSSFSGFSVFVHTPVVIECVSELGSRSQTGSLLRGPKSWVLFPGSIFIKDTRFTILKRYSQDHYQDGDSLVSQKQVKSRYIQTRITFESSVGFPRDTDSRNGGSLH